MLVGGCVRDEILGLEANDYDIASDALPETVQKLFNSPDLKNWRVIPSGIEHGTITLLSIREKFTFEVTTLRQDTACDGRHAEVAFGKSFYEDSCRRDFTINALYEDVWGHVYDFHNGLEDLRAGKLCFIGESSKRIQEDYLRIMRYFRFLAKYQFKANFDDLKTIKLNAANLKKLSQERLTQELLKILSCSKIGHIATMMDQCEVFSNFWDHSDLYLKSFKLPMSDLDLFDFTLADSRSKFEILALMRLAYFFIPNPIAQAIDIPTHEKEIFKFLNSLRLSKQQVHIVNALIKGCFKLIQFKDGLKISEALLFVEKLNKISHSINFFENVFYCFMKNILKYTEDPLSLDRTLETIHHYERTYAQRRTTMPIDGEQIQKIFRISAGPQVGTLLSILRIKYLNGEWTSIDEIANKNVDILTRKSLDSI